MHTQKSMFFHASFLTEKIVTVQGYIPRGCHSGGLDKNPQASGQQPCSSSSSSGEISNDKLFSNCLLQNFLHISVVGRDSIFLKRNIFINRFCAEQILC